MLAKLLDVAHADGQAGRRRLSVAKTLMQFVRQHLRLVVFPIPRAVDERDGSSPRQGRQRVERSRLRSICEFCVVAGLEL